MFVCVTTAESMSLWSYSASALHLMFSQATIYWSRQNMQALHFVESKHLESTPSWTVSDVQLKNYLVIPKPDVSAVF